MKGSHVTQNRKQDIFEYLDRNSELSSSFVDDLTSDDLRIWQEYYQQQTLLHDADISKNSLSIDVSQKVMERIATDVVLSSQKQSALNDLKARLIAFKSRFNLPMPNVTAPVVSLAVIALVFFVVISPQFDSLDKANVDKSSDVSLSASAGATVNSQSEIINEPSSISSSISSSIETITENALPMEYYIMYGSYSSQNAVTHELAAFAQLLN